MANVRMGLRLLETLTSALYEDPIIIFREYIQNSVDAYNRAIDSDRNNIIDNYEIKINLDKQHKTISIIDSGYGIEPDKFYEKMTSIGDSDKDQFDDQIGFRGIGRLSGMPFCKKLKFTNKVKGLKRLLVFIWDGEEFHTLLKQKSNDELNAAIDKISEYAEEEYLDNANDHFFKVEIIDYLIEIEETIDSKDFKDRLSLILPLNYSPNFSAQNEIKEHYQKFMDQDINKYSFNIKVDDTVLYKPYSDQHILESGLIFWELKFKSSKKMPGERFGILWFTFNRKVSANKDGPWGIYVRSKNMLMGDNTSLANAIIKSNKDYVATYRELTQTLQGVYGEMLIDTKSLEDNARRDWFKPDNMSIQLRSIIVEFLRRLYSYRYTASRTFNSIDSEKNREKLIKAYSELTGGYKQDIFVDQFYMQKAQNKKETKNNFTFADDDIPHSSITIKRFYDRMLTNIQAYYLEQEALQEFAKLRAFLKKGLSEKIP